jgi:hypothetical protein
MASEAGTRISPGLLEKLKPQLGVELGVVALFWLFCLLRTLGLDALGGWYLREPISMPAYLIIAGAVSGLFGVVIWRKLRFVAKLRARGVEVRARVLETQHSPRLSPSVFARGRYLVRIAFPNEGIELKSQVLCDQRPSTGTLQVVYDPLKPSRVWTPRQGG